MLKPADALLEPDPLFRDFVFRDSTKGDSRPMCMDDLRNMVAKIELTTRIPVAIREQFDIARAWPRPRSGCQSRRRNPDLVAVYGLANNVRRTWQKRHHSARACRHINYRRRRFLYETR
jgi:hypothetical protein